MKAALAASLAGVVMVLASGCGGGQSAESATPSAAEIMRPKQRLQAMEASRVAEGVLCAELAKMPKVREGYGEFGVSDVSPTVNTLDSVAAFMRTLASELPAKVNSTDSIVKEDAEHIASELVSLAEASEAFSAAVTEAAADGEYSHSDAYELRGMSNQVSGSLAIVSERCSLGSG